METQKLFWESLNYVASLHIRILGQSNFLACSSQKNSTHKTNDTPEVFSGPKGDYKALLY